MKQLIQRLSLAAMTIISAVALSGTSFSAVYAQDASVPNQTINTTLNSLNDSGASGTAEVELMDDNKVRVKLSVSGTSPDLPHAQHLHYTVDSEKVDNPDKIDTCPDPSADKDGDGIINTVEGQPFYGEVIVSLTTEGDVSAESGLAVDRFPVADENGNVNYERTFDIPEGVSREDITESVVVHHGISELFDDKAEYDGEPRSSLDPELPLEATVPAACGALKTMPVGGVGTGHGSTSGVENAPALAVGSIAAIAGLGLLVANRRKLNG